MLLTLLVGVDDALLETLRCPEIWVAGAVAAIAYGGVSDRTDLVLLPFVKVLLRSAAGQEQRCNDI